MCRFLRWRARYRQQAKHQKASQKRKRPQINQARLGSSHLYMSSGSDNQKHRQSLTIKRLTTGGAFECFVRLVKFHLIQWPIAPNNN